MTERLSCVFSRPNSNSSPVFGNGHAFEDLIIAEKIVHRIEVEMIRTGDPLGTLLEETFWKKEKEVHTSQGYCDLPSWKVLKCIETMKKAHGDDIEEEHWPVFVLLMVGDLFFSRVKYASPLDIYAFLTDFGTIVKWTHPLYHRCQEENFMNGVYQTLSWYEKYGFGIYSEPSGAFDRIVLFHLIRLVNTRVDAVSQFAQRLARMYDLTDTLILSDLQKPFDHVPARTSEYKQGSNLIQIWNSHRSTVVSKVAKKMSGRFQLFRKSFQKSIQHLEETGT